MKHNVVHENKNEDLVLITGNLKIKIKFLIYHFGITYSFMKIHILNNTQ